MMVRVVAGVAAAGLATSAAGANAALPRVVAARASGAVSAVPPSGAITVAAGDDHTCALTAAGGVKCWGDNTYGQLGDGTKSSRSRPVAVDGLSAGVVAIAAGGDHTCAALGAGGLRCWGRNATGELGDGTLLTRTSPVVVHGVSGVASSLSAGRINTCAVVSGRAWCWGDNGFGQIGDGTTHYRLVPTAVVGAAGTFESISVTANHTCARTSYYNAPAKCWGDNRWGQLGDGTTTRRLQPVVVAGLGTHPNVDFVVAGDSYSCARSSLFPYCWGRNDWGQLGDGTLNERHAPTRVTGSAGVLALSAGQAHTCAIDVRHTPSCWGRNLDGELGNGSTTRSSTPVVMGGISQATVVTAGGSGFSCAALAQGTVECTGKGGVLGDGIANSSVAPVVTLGFPVPPNPTLFWYDPTAGAAYTSLLSGGHYTPIKTVTGFKEGWTNIAIGRDTAMFYDSVTHEVASGLMLNGVFTQRSASNSVLQATKLAATCDSAVLYGGGSIFAVYTLSDGVATLDSYQSISGVYDTVVASCDTVLFYSSTTGAGLTGTLINGVWTQTGTPGFASGWNRITASNDSIFFVNTNNLHQVQGNFVDGKFTTEASGNGTRCADDHFAGTADSLVDERYCGGAPNAFVASFASGRVTRVTNLGAVNTRWTMIAGGR